MLDLEVLDEDDPFEIDDQVAHLFKHAALGVDDIYEVWQSDPVFFPAEPPAHWLMWLKLGVGCSWFPSPHRRSRIQPSAGRSVATTHQRT